MATKDSFSLFGFQLDAVEALRTAALNWAEHCAEVGAPRYVTTRIPFVGQLRAVTGAGKTPILASVVGSLGPAVVLWTTKSSAVVDQTVTHLQGRYRSLLGTNAVKIIREIPSQADWRHLIDSKSGLTIWVLTTASWNEAENAASGGSNDARLNLHRPQQDWSGATSPWDQLRNKLIRPLWVVSDESHNQSSAQLDQLAALGPLGFFMASATPVQNDLFDAWQKALSLDPAWRALAEAGRVPVRTRDVVEAELLKTTIDLVDFNSGAEESLDGVLAALAELDAAIEAERASLTPRAIYAVEKSNPTRGSKDEARPVFIWRYLVSRGVSPEQIAVFTDTKELPEDAEKITSLSQLQLRHRHIIFNQTLQEGWDDPEAYVCYFDGVTRSFLRIRQIVGRVLRQPRARRFASEALNTATLVLSTPADSYASVVSDLRTELRLYAPDNDPGRVPIRLKTRGEPLPAIPVRAKWLGKLSLARLTLSAPEMKKPSEQLRAQGRRPWAAEDLEAPGAGRKTVVELRDEGPERTEYIDVLRSARTNNGAYFRRRLGQRNRAALNSLHPDTLLGPAFEQESCQGSRAQAELNELVSKVADYFEEHVSFEQDSDEDRATWAVDEYRPRSKDLKEFRYAAHAAYSKNDFNDDERDFAEVLDKQRRGVWVRNAVNELGYSIPLPAKTGDSSKFYPDFLWWPVPEQCWAIDTTGRHLLQEKVQGKLIALTHPRVALVVRGQHNLQGQTQSPEGWTVVVARESLAPLVEHVDDLEDAIEVLASSVPK